MTRAQMVARYGSEMSYAMHFRDICIREGLCGRCTQNMYGYLMHIGFNKILPDNVFKYLVWANSCEINSDDAVNAVEVERVAHILRVNNLL